MERPQKENPEYKTLETVGVLSFFCLLFGILLDAGALIYAALGLLFIGLFVKPLALIIAGGWMKFAAALGALNTKVLLFVIFYLVLTPIAFLYRLFHGNVLNLRDDDPSRKSFWKERNHSCKPEDLEKQW